MEDTQDVSATGQHERITEQQHQQDLQVAETLLQLLNGDRSSVAPSTTTEIGEHPQVEGTYGVTKESLNHIIIQKQPYVQQQHHLTQGNSFPQPQIVRHSADKEPLDPGQVGHVDPVKGGQEHVTQMQVNQVVASHGLLDQGHVLQGHVADGHVDHVAVDNIHIGQRQYHQFGQGTQRQDNQMSNYAVQRQQQNFGLYPQQVLEYQPTIQTNFSMLQQPIQGYNPVPHQYPTQEEEQNAGQQKYPTQQQVDNNQTNDHQNVITLQTQAAGNPTEGGDAMMNQQTQMFVPQQQLNSMMYQPPVLIPNNNQTILQQGEEMTDPMTVEARNVDVHHQQRFTTNRAQELINMETPGMQQQHDMLMNGIQQCSQFNPHMVQHPNIFRQQIDQQPTQENRHQIFDYYPPQPQQQKKFSPQHVLDLTEQQKFQHIQQRNQIQHTQQQQMQQMQAQQLQFQHMQQKEVPMNQQQTQDQHLQHMQYKELQQNQHHHLQQMQQQLHAAQNQAGGIFGPEGNEVVSCQPYEAPIPPGKTRYRTGKEFQLQTVTSTRRMSKKTAYNEKWGLKSLSVFLMKKGFPYEPTSISPHDLQTLLPLYFASLRKADGTLYSYNSLVNIRRLINLYMRDAHPERLDIVANPLFRKATEVFEDQLRRTMHYTKPFTSEQISHEHFNTIVNGNTFTTDSRDSLLVKIWFDLTRFFVQQSQLPQYEWRRNMLKVFYDRPCDKFYVTWHVPYNNLINNDKEIRMYETKQGGCPVACLALYMCRSTSGSGAEKLFQQTSHNDKPHWYGPDELRRDEIDRMMTTISEMAALPVKYRNESVTKTSFKDISLFYPRISFNGGNDLTEEFSFDEVYQCRAHRPGKIPDRRFQPQPLPSNLFQHTINQDVGDKPSTAKDALFQTAVFLPSFPHSLFQASAFQQTEQQSAVVKQGVGVQPTTTLPYTIQPSLLQSDANIFPQIQPAAGQLSNEDATNLFEAATKQQTMRQDVTILSRAFDIAVTQTAAFQPDEIRYVENFPQFSTLQSDGFQQTIHEDVVNQGGTFQNDTIQYDPNQSAFHPFSLQTDGFHAQQPAANHSGAFHADPFQSAPIELASPLKM